MSVLAGIMISIACGVYLTVGGPVGAVLFAVGLLGILYYGMDLFTGKAGLDMRLADLGIVWLGNLVGTGIGSALLLMFNPGLSEAAKIIAQSRVDAGWESNFCAGIVCGVLMYVAIRNWNAEKNNLLPIMCVAAFILVGANHCVADMGYFWLADDGIRPLINVVYVTIGNFIGCKLIPIVGELTKKNDSPLQ